MVSDSGVTGAERNINSIFLFCKKKKNYFANKKDRATRDLYLFNSMQAGNDDRTGQPDELASARGPGEALVMMNNAFNIVELYARRYARAIVLIRTGAPSTAAV